MYILRFTLCLLGLTYLVNIVYSCDYVHIQRCEYEFADEIGVPLEYLEAGLMNDLTRETLESYCRAYDRFEDCVKTYNGYCSLEYRVVLEGIEDLYGYICGEGFEAHLRHEPCLSTSSMETEITKCNEQAYRDFDAFFLTKEDVCSIFKDGLDCVEEAVDAECGSDAADHQLEIEKSYLRPRAEAIDCDLDEKEVNTAMIVGVIMGLCVFIVISICICLYCSKKNRKPRANQEHNQMNAITQPGATAPSYVITQPGAVAPTYPGTEISSPPPYNEYQILNAEKAPVYDNPSYLVPQGGTDNHAYTGLPGKE